MELAYLCKCNMCDTVMFDENPTEKTEMKPITGNESHMEKKMYYEDNETVVIWVCPNCLTDEFLTDL